MKFFLRRDEQVELFNELDPLDDYWTRFGRETRSVMAELLTAEEARHLEISEGRWHLPGPPP